MTFIAIEGNDGSGKATQTALLKEALEREGCACATFAFPAYQENVFGQLLGECLAGKRGDFVNLDPKIASTLYMVDRHESAREIRSALASGKVVISDRYNGSNLIHQGGKASSNMERLLLIEWLNRAEHEVLGNPKPDLVIYLKAPVHVSLEMLAKKRASKGGVLADDEMDQAEKDLIYLTNSHGMANWLAEYYDHWQVVSCVEPDGQMRSREAIHEDVLREVRTLM